MKKIYISFLIVFILSLSSAQPVAAVSGFTLKYASMKSPDQYDESFQLFWRGIQLEFTDAGNGILTAYAENGASATSSDGLTTYTTTGQIDGNFDPGTGKLSGQYSITNLAVFHRETAGGVEHYEILVVYSGDYQELLNSKDTSVSISFSGKRTQNVTGNYPKGWTANGEVLDFTRDDAINVVFNIKGSVTMTGTEDTKVVNSVPDSGARFSWISGQVEINIPKGIDENGKYIYDPEDWKFAKYDTVLPYGTHIKTSEDSTALLSFPDMSVYEEKSETQIILSAPPEKTGNLQLLAGKLLVNIKRVLKDGTMEIEMSQAVAGIKGTTLVLEETGTTSTLKVIEGSVAFTSRGTGEVELVNAGQAITADASGLKQVQNFDVKAEKSTWSSLENTQPAKPEIKRILILYYSMALGLVLLILLVVLFTRKNKGKP